MKVKVTERGWPGHFIAARACIFRRNTLLEGDKGAAIVVSTVGYLRDSDGSVREIGYDRYYETMAFVAKDGGYRDADVSLGVQFDGKWSICKAEMKNPLVDLIANKMHEDAVTEISNHFEDYYGKAKDENH